MRSLKSIREEMSIAGSPDKLIRLMKDMRKTMSKVDKTNPAELTNIQFVLEELLKISHSWKRQYEKRTGQFIF